MILEKTIDRIKEIYQDHKISPLKVTKIVIGLGYTGVEVSNYVDKSFLGLASTLPTVVNITDCSKINFANLMSILFQLINDFFLAANLNILWFKARFDINSKFTFRQIDDVSDRSDYLIITP